MHLEKSNKNTKVKQEQSITQGPE